MVFASAIEFLLSSSDAAGATSHILAISSERLGAYHVDEVCFVATGDTGGFDAAWIGDVLQRVDVDAVGS